MIHYITTIGIGQPTVTNELLAVQRAGIPFTVHALRRSRTSYFLSGDANELACRTRFIYPIEPLRTLTSIVLAPFLFRRHFFAALWNAIFGRRESFVARVKTLAHFFVACHWARDLRDERPSLIHSQWIHSCGSVGMYGAWLLDAPFSFTGHAADLFRDRVALEDKIRRADFIVCISEFHRRLYLENGAHSRQLHLAYCGIDIRRFRLKSTARHAQSACRILSSGRLVEKKGFRYLIEACRLLADQGESFECIIAGDGPLEVDIRTRIRRAGLGGRVRVSGEALKQEKVQEFMEGGDIYCLPCVWACDGDVDGLPQMLMEAMAVGLPVVSTRLVGIPDLIVDEETGLLVEPNDAGELASALSRLMHDAALVERLARSGRQLVVEKFEIDSSLLPLLDQFRKKLAS